MMRIILVRRYVGCKCDCDCDCHCHCEYHLYNNHINETYIDNDFHRKLVVFFFDFFSSIDISKKKKIVSFASNSASSIMVLGQLIATDNIIAQHSYALHVKSRLIACFGLGGALLRCWKN